MDELVTELFAEFEVARRSAKPSPHLEQAARSDFAAIHALRQEAAGSD